MWLGESTHIEGESLVWTDTDLLLISLVCVCVCVWKFKHEADHAVCQIVHAFAWKINKTLDGNMFVSNIKVVFLKKLNPLCVLVSLPR